MKKLFLFTLLLSLASSSAFAQPSVSGAQWQFSRQVGQKRLPYAGVAAFSLSPAGALPGRTRVVLTISNTSSVPAEGLVLRYAFSIRISSGGAPGVWTVPFHVSETRISRLAPDADQKVSIYQPNLNAQLRRLKGTGFLPLALKVKVMTEPRSGDDLSLMIREFEIPFKGAE